MAGRVVVDRLLQSALPLVPEYGFTLAAVRKAIELNPMSSATSHQPKDLDRVLAILFPGPDTAPTSAPRRLFQAWDEDAWAITVSNSTDKAVRDAKAERIPRQAAFDSAVHLLSDRLSYSTNVQPHLLPTLALVSSLPLKNVYLGPLAPRLREQFKLPAITANIPNPFPLTKRATHMADLACTAAGLSGKHGPEWYALRTRLGAAYGAAELTMAAQPDMSYVQVAQLLERIANTPGPMFLAHQASQRLHQWAEWGGRGWLGILRSWGL